MVIDKDGSILLDDGRHRVAIAEILGIDSIPVNVLARHSGWQVTRERVDQGKIGTDQDSEICLNHPDLEDVV